MGERIYVQSEKCRSDWKCVAYSFDASVSAGMNAKYYLFFSEHAQGRRERGGGCFATDVDTACAAEESFKSHTCFKKKFETYGDDIKAGARKWRCRGGCMMLLLAVIFECL